MNIDFSNVNLEYLLHARDIAREDHQVAASLLGTPPELATLLTQAPNTNLAKISRVKMPLMAVRGDAVWWFRLFKALAEENEEELDVILQAVNLTLLA